MLGLGLSLGLAPIQGVGWRERVLVFDDPAGTEFVLVFDDPAGAEYVLTGDTL